MMSHPRPLQRVGCALRPSGSGNDVASDTREPFDLSYGKSQRPQLPEGAIPLALVEQCQPVCEIGSEVGGGYPLRLGFA